jgi:hypothetical protein
MHIYASYIPGHLGLEEARRHLSKVGQPPHDHLCVVDTTSDLAVAENHTARAGMASSSSTRASRAFQAVAAGHRDHAQLLACGLPDHSGPG